MCLGGGSNKAADAANQAEAQRQANIQQSIGQINSVYASPQRQQQYADFSNALQQSNLQQLNQQQVDANRNLNFAMARQGLTGGSADADSAARQERLYNQALLKGQQSADSAAAQLRAQDQQSKQGLISLAESGLSATDASNQALETMQANIQNAQAQAAQQSLGDAFSGLGDYFAQSQNAANARRLLANPTGQGLFSPNTPYTGPGSMVIAPWLANPNIGNYFRG